MATDTNSINEMREHKAGSIRDLTGLSYRQLNDWEERGALPEVADRGSKWRTYNPREIFILQIMASLRKRYGVPVEKLKFIKDCMTAEGADHLQYAVEKMSMLGVSIWLITDFDRTFLLDTELEISDMFGNAWFHSDQEDGYFLINLTPMIQRLCTSLDTSISLNLHMRGFQLRGLANEAITAKSVSEVEVLKRVRNKDVTRVELTMKDGSVKTTKITRKRDLNSVLEEVIKENDFQNIQFFVRDGKTVEVIQSLTYKESEKVNLTESGTTG